MSFDIGSRIGSLEITGLLGRGGMGEVYRARDLKLKREVAVKILPELFSSDADRAARFQREAQVLASLNHPRIGAIYDVAQHEDVHYLILELVEGETLADRIARGPIPLAEALPIAAQIAEALEAAHDKDVIHRDLKPANIKITPGGEVKVLDFGLAKSNQPDNPPSTADSPTMLSMTSANAGVILGTAAYMSPEQARGRRLNRRSDIFAFGAVLYEMLTGRPAFDGEDITEILGRVVTTEPDWSRIPPDTPPPVQRLLKRCLKKDERSRLRDIGDARIELSDLSTESGSEPTGERSARPMREKIAWAACALAVVIAALALLREQPPAAPPAVMHLELTTPSTQDVDSLAISPDGRQIAFVGTVDRKSSLMVRSLESGSTRVLEGTVGASSPFWSPDSKNIAFRSAGKLKRIELDHGSIQTLADVRLPMGGGSWSPAGDILFPPIGPTGVFRVSESGGKAERVTVMEAQQGAHGNPYFLPDGQHFLFTAQSGAAEQTGVYIATHGTPQARRLLSVGTPTAYVAGRLLFIKEGTLFAQTFDLKTLELSGNPEAISDRVRTFSASANGTIVIRGQSQATDPGLNSIQRNVDQRFVWLDRSGRELSAISGPGGTSPSISPDGNRLTVHRTTGGNTDIWIIDIKSGTSTRFTSNPGPELHPLWSPDGSRILFSLLQGPNRLAAYEKPVAGGEEKLLFQGRAATQVADWSRDGKFLLLRVGQDLWALPMDGSGEAFQWLNSEFSKRDGQFSPDGQWVAYASNDSGRFEIYLQTFPKPGRKFVVSTEGGYWPRWRSDGKELYYVALDNRIMAVPIQLHSQTDPEIGSRSALFTAPFRSLLGIDPQQYIVSPDGLRFLINAAVDETPAPLTVILNWRSKAGQ